MLTVIIKRSDEPKVIQLTQENIMRELGTINGSEMLLEDSWLLGLRKVRTPYVCLVEADCTLSANYLSSNFGLMRKTSWTENGKGGGYTKLAMIASCLGVRDFGNRIYSFSLQQEKTKDYVDEEEVELKYYQIRPDKKKQSTGLYAAQVGFVPGAIMRMSSLTEIIGEGSPIPWDSQNLVQLSSALSFHLWSTNRRININPNTTYVSNEAYLENPPHFDHKAPERALDIFKKEWLWETIGMN